MAEPGIWWPYVVLLVGAAATYFWRGLGVALSGRIDPDGPVFEWIACVAYALLAGLIARMIVLPTGPLAGTPLTHRIAAAVIALAIYFLTRRNILAGVGVGVGALVLLTWGRVAIF